MPRIVLTPEQVVQLNEWLFGGPTDPTGLISWLTQNSSLAGTPVYENAAGQREAYEVLLAKNGQNIRRQDFSDRAWNALLEVKASLDVAESRGWAISQHQQRMRAIWSEVSS